MQYDICMQVRITAHSKLKREIQINASTFNGSMATELKMLGSTVSTAWIYDIAAYITPNLVI